ncbi:DUF4349 domain-containing protein [Haliangium sp.]|uniref:DUF4349 domain-containing protein n=3 Tax=Haliangium sp. TaxID=2663208 RepID=UPI003D12A43A
MQRSPLSTSTRVTFTIALAGCWLATAGACTRATSAPPYTPTAAPASEALIVPVGLDEGEAVMVTGSVVDRVATHYAQASSPAPSPPSPGPAPASNQSPNQAGPRAEPASVQLVVEGWVTLEVDDVSAVAATLAAQVEAQGGRVVHEELSGAGGARTGSLQIKLPPTGVESFLDWMDGLGDITQKRVQSTDVSRTLFDQAIALENLHRTLERLRALLDGDDLAMADILAIEKEMTRLRGEIERIKGEKRFLEHRVALATLTVSLRTRDDAVQLGEQAKAKLYPGPRASVLYLPGADGDARLRLGAGLAVHLMPRVNLEVDAFEAPDGERGAVLATVGGGLYSDFLGRGRRRFFNPYLDVRLGVAYLDGAAFAFGAGAGVELFKHDYLLVDTNVRVLGLAGDSFDTAVVAGASLVFAF